MFRVAAREHTLASRKAPPRHSRMNLAARQNTPAIDGASTVQIVHYINSSPVFIHNRRNRSRRPALGGRERILLDNSRVYVRFLPFVSGRVHLGRMTPHLVRAPLEPHASLHTFYEGAKNLNPRVSATPPSRWTITPLFYSQSTDLPVLRGRRVAEHRKAPDRWL